MVGSKKAGNYNMQVFFCSILYTDLQARVLRYRLLCHYEVGTGHLAVISENQQSSAADLCTFSKVKSYKQSTNGSKHQTQEMSPYPPPTPPRVAMFGEECRPHSMSTSECAALQSTEL